jgi:hypothetical protein
VRANLRLSAVPHRAGPDIVARVQRTTTTATLLVTVAVSALSGCVTVQRPPESGPPSAAPSGERGSAPRPDGTAGPRDVQAPAREALEMISPSRRAQPKAPEPAPAEPTREAPADHPRPRPRPHPPADHPDSRHHWRSRVDIPDVTRPFPTNPAPESTDVCALGRKYGGWRADSPEAVICRQTYGR